MDDDLFAYQVDGIQRILRTSSEGHLSTLSLSFDRGEIEALLHQAVKTRQRTIMTTYHFSLFEQEHSNGRRPNKRTLYVAGLDQRVTEEVLRQISKTTGDPISVPSALVVWTSMSLGLGMRPFEYKKSSLGAFSNATRE
ncbi:rna recognition domain-containing protein [Fusarium napiforme]|uniref:Rna recognition domain-containing protein n=1 Tax=Fusarium napiforme TaxID=42672 RepID=A0A8H5MIH5_9HYPO|nr:rna recognition domain-containing protein [Fusarium napiforme]